MNKENKLGMGLGALLSTPKNKNEITRRLLAKSVRGRPAGTQPVRSDPDGYSDRRSVSSQGRKGLLKHHMIISSL